MTQTLPLSLVLGASNAAKLIGYTVLNLDRTEYAAFTLVTESAVAGTYYAIGGYSAPDAGGYLVVSESDGGNPAVLTALIEVDTDPIRVSFPFSPDTAGATYEDLVEGMPSGGLTAQETADAVHNLAPDGTPAIGSIGSHLDLILNGLTGVGLLPLIYTVTVTGTATPIEGVTVEVYTEEACINCIRRGTTDSFGVITFWFTTPGTYWLRREKDGVTFVNPDSEIVSV